MKPFLTLQDGFLEMFQEWTTILRPFGDFDNPNEDISARAAGLCDIADTAVRGARGNFSQLKSLGAAKVGAAKVEKEWLAVSIGSQQLFRLTNWSLQDVSSCIASSVAAGLAVSNLRSAISKDKTSALLLELPEPGKRYHEWWVVPKLSLKTA